MLPMASRCNEVTRNQSELLGVIPASRSQPKTFVSSASSLVRCRIDQIVGMDLLGGVRISIETEFHHGNAFRFTVPECKSKNFGRWKREGIRQLLKSIKNRDKRLLRGVFGGMNVTQQGHGVTDGHILYTRARDG